MGGTTITIQKDRLLDAIEELISTKQKIYDEYYLHFDRITILFKDEKNKYYCIGDKDKEMLFGQMTTKNENKNFVIFAHFGK